MKTIKTIITSIAFVIISSISYSQGTTPDLSFLEGTWTWYQSYCGWIGHQDTSTVSDSRELIFSNYSYKGEGIYTIDFVSLLNDSIILNNTTDIRILDEKILFKEQIIYGDLGFFNNELFIVDSTHIYFYPYNVYDACSNYYYKEESADNGLEVLNGTWSWYESICGWGYNLDSASAGYKTSITFSGFSPADSSLQYMRINNDTDITSGVAYIRDKGQYLVIYYDMLPDTGMFSFGGTILNIYGDSIISFYPEYLMDGCTEYYGKEKDVITKIPLKEKAPAELLIYYVPQDAVLYIKSSGKEFNPSYHIFNTSGQLIRSGKVYDQQIPVIGLSAGIYILKLSDNQKTKGVKFMISN